MGSAFVKISDALAGITRLYIDTPPIIYYVETNPGYIARMDEVIRRVKSDSIRLVCSVITLTEVLPIPMRAKRVDLVGDYRSILLKSREFVCKQVTQTVAETAADLRARYNLRTPDALHLATAITTDCTAFLTNDLGLKRVKEITILVLDELEI